MAHSKGGLNIEYLEEIPFDFFQEFVKEGLRIQNDPGEEK